MIELGTATTWIKLKVAYKVLEIVLIESGYMRKVRIDIFMHVINTTKARKELYNLIQEVNKNSEPVLITGKECNAVLISQNDWDSICETIQLKSVPGLEESLLKGKESSLSDCITEEVIEKIAEFDEYVAVMRSLTDRQRSYLQSLVDSAMNGDQYIQIFLRRWKNLKCSVLDRTNYAKFFELPEEAQDLLYRAIVIDLKKERDYAAWVRKD